MPMQARSLMGNQEAGDFATSFMVDTEVAEGSRSPWQDERDGGTMDVAATQVLQGEEEGDDEQEVERLVEQPAPVAEPEQESEQEELSAEQRFVRAFDAVWARLEESGWQIARGPDTMFCAMPGVQFFNFRPNMNVFDSKEKACWKFIAQAREQPESAADAIVWDTLWSIAERHFGWFTMQCGPETMFIKPGTRFEDFKPNETIFQTKKGAVLKCLAAEVGKIELGDSIEGHQVISFEAEKPKPKPKPRVKLVAAKEDAEHTPAHSSALSFKTPSPKVPKQLPTPASGRSKYITPPTKRSIASSSSSSTKKKPAGSSASKKSLKLKGKAKSKSKKASPALPEKDPNAFVFQEPAFRISFGLVYQQLQDMGWRHRSGQFEYDYFSPTFDKATAVLNRDYFQSKAEFETFLRSSGLWDKVERELRAEHDEYVAELRYDAKQKHDMQLAKTAKRRVQVSKMSTALKAPEEERPVPKKARSAAKKPASSAVKKPMATGSSPRWTNEISAFRQEAEHGHPAVTIGRVTKKLYARGWTVRAGRFEYDYFKPGVTNKKTARLNEDYFESTADLEMHLKLTGIWDRIAREIEEDHFAKQEQLAIQMSQEDGDKVMKPEVADDEESKESDPPSQNQSHSQSLSSSQSQPQSQSQAEPQSQPEPTAGASSPTQHLHLKRKASPPPLTSLSSPGVKKPRSPGINKRDVQALTNEIWANSHEFDFDE